MVLGMTVAQFTVLHVAISMVAIFAGFIVVGAMFSNSNLVGWTAFFLATTILTNITGFLFPFGGVTPGIVVGALSTLLLIVAMIALYSFNLRDIWRAIYVVTATLGLYFNVFVLIVQSFQKVGFLQTLAPTGSEPPFVITQAATLLGFVLLGWLGLRAFRPLRPAT